MTVGTVTFTEAEMAVLDGVSAGTVTASKAVVVNASKRIDTINVGTILLNDGTVTASNTAINNLVQGTTSGWKVNRGTIALDGSNPTPVATGLTTVEAFSAQLTGTAAPGLNTSLLTYNTTVTGGTVNVYAWKVTGAGDTTLIASTGTETFAWIAVGT